MVAVSDTGFGMDEQTKARIFEPFFTTKEVGKGTGLGLASVHGIIEQSGGRVYVYSEPGHGTTFKMFFPAVDAPLAAQAIERSPLRSMGGTETVLIAEDAAGVRVVACEGLRKNGYEILEAESAAVALDIASAFSGTIHLLVTDIVMPGKSGRQLAEELAVLRPHMKVLFVSGYTNDALIHHGMLGTGFNLLQKPFTPASLARRVREVLDARQLSV
jgi:CheY-like chemotaxis protein